MFTVLQRLVLDLWQQENDNVSSRETNYNILLKLINLVACTKYQITQQLIGVRMTYVYDEMVRHLLISIYSGIILFSSSRSVACPSGRSGTTKCADIS